MADEGISLTSKGILDKYQQMYQEARAANEQRYSQGIGILDQAIERYSPGGTFGAGAQAQYDIGKRQSMASGQQALVNSGLSNTTVAAGLPLAYEQEVGTPFRLQLNDMRMKNLTSAEQAKTDFIEKREDPYPDFGMFAQLAMQSATSGGGGSTIDWEGFNTWDNPSLRDAFEGGSSGGSSSGGLSGSGLSGGGSLSSMTSSFEGKTGPIPGGIKFPDGSTAWTYEGARNYAKKLGEISGGEEEKAGTGNTLGDYIDAYGKGDLIPEGSSSFGDYQTKLNNEMYPSVFNSG